MKKRVIFLTMVFIMFNCCSYTYMFRADQELDITKRIPNTKKEVLYKITKNQLRTNYDIAGTDIIYDNINEGKIRTRNRSYSEVGSFFYTMEIEIKDDTLKITYDNIISDKMGKKRRINLDSKWEILFDRLIELRTELITCIINDIIKIE